MDDLEKAWDITGALSYSGLIRDALREWFCQTMGELSVPDRFIDAFCGRTPKSVRARHYSDYSLERLKRIYDQVGLKVLS